MSERREILVPVEVLERIAGIASEDDCSRCPNRGNRSEYEGCGLEVCLSVIKNIVNSVLRTVERG